MQQSSYYVDEPYILSDYKDVSDIVISPNSSYIAVTSKYKDKYRCSFHKCCNAVAIVKTYSVEKDRNATVFTPDGKYCLLVGFHDIKVLNCSNLTEARVIKINDDDYLKAIVSPDSKVCAVTSKNDLCYVYAIASGKLLHTFSNMCDRISHIACNHDSTRLYITCGSRCSVYDLKSGKQIIAKNLGQDICNIALDPSGIFCALMTAQPCSVVLQNNLDCNVFKLEFDNDEACQVHRMAWSCDGKMLGIVSSNKCFLYTCKNGKIEYKEQFRCKKDIKKLAFCASGSQLLVSDDVACEIYDYAQSKLLQSINVHCFEGADIIWSADGKHLLVTCEKEHKLYYAYPTDMLIKLSQKEK